MKSEIKLISPSFKLGVTIGLFVTILIIWLSLVYRWEFSFILIATGSSIFLIGIAGSMSIVRKIIHRGRIYGIEERKAEQELRLITYQADKAGLERFILSFPASQRQLISPNAPVKLIEAAANSYKALSTQEPTNLLDVVCQEQRVLIKGISNAGKTNLLQWIASRKQATSKVLVIDPHSSPDKWAGCQVVGTGSNHPEIEIALDKLIALMVKRYQDIAQGTVQEGQHSKLTILIDEWMSIAYQCRNAKEAMVRLLTESRKAAFSIYIGSHSERVASLGLDGKGDLRDGFCLVRLSLVNGERSAIIDYGNGEQDALLPGAFAGNGQTLESPEYINLEVQPSPTEAFVIKLYEQGESKRNICEQVYGYVSSNKYPEIDRILTKFNIK